MIRRLQNAVVCIFVILFIVFCGGCASRTPTLAQDCEIKPYVEQWDSVEDCKHASQRREDYLFRKSQVDAAKYRCVVPSIWDGRSQKCLSRGHRIF